MRTVKFLMILCFLMVSGYSQKTVLEKSLSKSYGPDEVVSLSETITFEKALEVLSNLSEKHSGKKVVTTSNFAGPIGIRIENMYYKKAVIIVAQYNNLVVDERENVIIIANKEDKTKGVDPKTYADVTEKEIRISAVFFEANITEMNERGINWEFLLSGKGVTLGSEIVTFGETQENQNQNQATAKAPDYTISTQTNFNMGSFKGNAAAAFKFFETENLGDVIAKPSVVVRNKTQGLIQIGSDISIKQKDFSGNIVETLVPTGTIVKVTPHIFEDEDLNYCLLNLEVERSSANVEAVTTQINKTKATTEVLLLDGEETIIGGLFVNEEVTGRRGIPILKDLPWWVLGIKYLTGYEYSQTIKKEIIILIKAEIIPSIKERINLKKSENLIQEKYEQDIKEISKYKVDKLKKDK